MSNQELDQFYYTSAQTGLGRSPGFRVRAASPGLYDLRSMRFAELEKYLNYYQPDGANALSPGPDDAPISFAFVRNKIELLLLRKVYLGRTFIGSPGNYFVHVLAGLSPDFAAREAISLWESTFWQHQDPLPPDVVELPFVSERDLRAQAGFDGTRLLAEKRDQDALCFVIQAFLSLSLYSNQRLYIAAPADKTAAFIWGLTQALPQGLLEQLTFSTYEHDVQQTSILIVGTCWTRSKIASGMDLPASCYSGNGLALNYYSNKSSPLEALKRADETYKYAHFAVGSLCGNKSDLDGFRRAAEQDGVNNIEGLLVFYRPVRIGTVVPVELTKEDYDYLVSTPALVARLFKGPSFQQNVIVRARQDRLWWQQHGLTLFKTLSSDSDPEIQETLEAFAERAVAAAKEALQPVQIVRPMRAVDEALWIINNLARPAVARQDHGIPFRALFELCSRDSSFTVPADLTWQEREQLLTEWDQCLASDTTPSQWLDIPPSEVAQFLRVRLNHSQWRIAAIRNAIVDSSSGEQVRDHILSWIQINKASVLAAVRGVASDGQQMPMLTKVFEGIGRQDVGLRRELLAEVIRAAGTTASASSIVRAVTGKLNPNALDPQDWDDLLAVPTLAAQVLQKSAFQEGIVECATRDRRWGERDGKRSIARLSEAAITNREWQESLRGFAEYVTTKSKELPMPVRTDQAIWDAIWLLDNLAVAAVSAWEPTFPYRKLYEACSRDNHFRVPSELPWETRQWLLTKWAPILPQHELPKQWLNMPADQVNRLMQVPAFRATWKQQALYYVMIDPGSAKDIPSYLASWVRTDKGIVFDTVCGIASDEQGKATLRAVFDRLGPASGNIKVELLETLIDRMGDKPGFDGIVSVARLNPLEFGMLLRGKKRDWVMGCLTAKQVEGETIRELMRDYLRTLDLAKAGDEFNSQLLEDLRRRRSGHARDLYLLVESWDDIVGLIQNDDLTEGVDLLSASWSTLDKGIRDQCGPALVESIASRLNSPGELERVLQKLGSLLCASESELFGRLFVFAGKQSARDIGRLGPYFYLAYTLNPSWKARQAEFRGVLQNLTRQVEGRAKIPSLQGTLKAYCAIYRWAYDENAFRQDLAKFYTLSPSVGVPSLDDLVGEGVKVLDKFLTGLYGGGDAQPKPKVATQTKALEPTGSEAGTRKITPGPSSASTASNQGSTVTGQARPASDKTGGAVASESKPKRTKSPGYESYVWQEGDNAETLKELAEKYLGGREWVRLIWRADGEMLDEYKLKPGDELWIPTRR